MIVRDDPGAGGTVFGDELGVSVAFGMEGDESDGVIKASLSPFPQQKRAKILRMRCVTAC
jgi:hypothetical protein